jgi:hypothetical protein
MPLKLVVIQRSVLDRASDAIHQNQTGPSERLTFFILKERCCC